MKCANLIYGVGCVSLAPHLKSIQSQKDCAWITI
jgi:hypothetical protein